MLTSTSNPKIKLVRALAKKQTRQEKKQFGVEGVRLIDEAVRAGTIRALISLCAASALLTLAAGYYLFALRWVARLLL